MKKSDLADTLVILPKATLDKMFREKKAGMLIAVYVLYYYTCKWQKTNQVWCNDNYVSKKLTISSGTARKYRLELERLGLITSISKKRDKLGRWTKPYIKLNYVWKKETVQQLTEQQEPLLG